MYLCNIHFNMSLKHVQCTHTCTCMPRAQIATYKEDFNKERDDRSKAVEKADALEAKVRELKNSLEAMEVHKKAELDNNKQLLAELEAAKEEIAVKVAQVKQYQKQVEAYKQQALLTAQVHVHCTVLNMCMDSTQAGSMVFCVVKI